MKKIARIILLSLIAAVMLIACGPAEMGFSNLVVKNDSKEAIKKVEVDSIEIKDNLGKSVTIDAGDSIDLYLEFVTEETHEIQVTYASGKTEMKEDKLSVNTNSTNSMTFGTEPPETSKFKLTNNTTEAINYVYFCDVETVNPEENFDHVKVPDLLLGGIAVGASTEMAITAEGTFFVYISDLDGPASLQGSVDLVYNTSVSMTAE